ncbi:MAG: ATP-binding protein [Gammaproteobacteria bacterium]|nr:ATP-binding protein [Gammaproteobacteria bacterium]
MDIYERSQLSILLERLDEVPKRLIFITGPRQTGKTTLVKQALEQIDRPHRYLSADEVTPATFPKFPLPGPDPTLVSDKPANPVPEKKDIHWLVRHWEQARVEAVNSESGFVLVFDEIQKIANWSETVKGLWDADRWRDIHLHIVLLGSAPLLMQRGMTESLAGRYETIHLTHWSFSEMSAAFGFDVNSYIYFGGYPGAAQLISSQERWREYVTGALIEPNIERDILALERVDKPALLKKLFEYGTDYSGQIVSYTKMQGQLQDAGNTTTLARYLDLLANAGLIVGLIKYAGSIHHRRSSSPKLNVLNTALMSAQSGYAFEEAQSDRSFWGRMVESAIGAHLLNTARPEYRIFYWKENAFEVDFVLERRPKLIAVEVKSGARRRSIGGIKKFEGRFNVTNSILIGADGIPVADFLRASARDLLQDL